MKYKKMFINVFNNLFGNINSKNYWNKKLDYRKSWEKRNNIYLNLVPLFPEQISSILDVGCSTGDGCIVLKNVLPEMMVSGCDFSDVGIKHAQSKSDNIHFFNLDIVQGRITQDYDCILLVSILEHLQEYHSVIQKCLNNCKVLIISVPYNERVSIFGLKPSEHLHSFNEGSLMNYDVSKIKVEGKRITYVLSGKLNLGEKRW